MGSSCVIRVSEGAAKSNSLIHGSRWSWVSKRASLACGASRCRVVLTLLFKAYTTNVRIFVRVVGPVANHSSMSCWRQVAALR